MLSTLRLHFSIFWIGNTQTLLNRHLTIARVFLSEEFFDLFDTYLLSTTYVPGTGLDHAYGTENTIVTLPLFVDVTVYLSQLTSHISN